MTTKKQGISENAVGTITLVVTLVVFVGATVIATCGVGSAGPPPPDGSTTAGDR